MRCLRERDVTYAWLTDPECGVLTWLEEVAGLDNESDPAKEALEAAKTAVSTSSKDLADPDAPGGDQAVRTDHDAFWETLWTQVRAGKLEDAMAFCNESKQQWRAAALQTARHAAKSRRLAALPEEEEHGEQDSNLMASNCSNLTRQLWRDTACELWKKARAQPTLPPPPRACFAASLAHR